MVCGAGMVWEVKQLCNSYYYCYYENMGHHGSCWDVVIRVLMRVHTFVYCIYLCWARPCVFLTIWPWALCYYGALLLSCMASGARVLTACSVRYITSTRVPNGTQVLAAHTHINLKCNNNNLSSTAVVVCRFTRVTSNVWDQSPHNNNNYTTCFTPHMYNKLALHIMMSYI